MVFGRAAVGKLHRKLHAQLVERDSIEVESDSDDVVVDRVVRGLRTWPGVGCTLRVEIESEAGAPDVRVVGRAFGAPFDVVFSQFDVVEPDLLCISNARLDVLTTTNVQGAPNLVVEIGSPSTRQRDETIKRKLYERFGVEEYWVIDPEIETIAVYRRTGESYQRVLELAVERDDTLTTPLLPGLQLPLERIFKD